MSIRSDDETLVIDTYDENDNCWYLLQPTFQAWSASDKKDDDRDNDDFYDIDDPIFNDDGGPLTSSMTIIMMMMRNEDVWRGESSLVKA